MLSLYVGQGAREPARSGLVMLALFLVIYALPLPHPEARGLRAARRGLLGFAALTAVMFATLRVDWSAGWANPPARTEARSHVRPRRA